MINDVLKALAEPRRREILRLIQYRELAAGEIAAHFEVSRPAISQHLKVLVEANLVTVRQERTSRLYRARPEGLADLRHFIEDFWDSQLRLLKEAVEAAEQESSE